MNKLIVKKRMLNKMKLLEDLINYHHLYNEIFFSCLWKKPAPMFNVSNFDAMTIK